MARRKADGTTAAVKRGGHNPARMTEVGLTKKKSGGNSRCDQEWLAEMRAEGLISEIDPKTLDPKEYPWDIELLYEGYADEINPDFFEFFRRGSRQCTGISYIRDERGGYIIDLDGMRLQRLCLAVPMLGAHVCQKHGGQVPHVREAAQRRLSHAAEKAANTLITLTDLRDEAGELVDQKVRLGAANSVLDRTGVKGGVEVEVTTPGFKRVMEKMFGEGEEE